MKCFPKGEECLLHRSIPRSDAGHFTAGSKHFRQTLHERTVKGCLGKEMGGYSSPSFIYWGEGSGVEQILSYETAFLCVVIEKTR
jgi:hypothetical protein